VKSVRSPKRNERAEQNQRPEIRRCPASGTQIAAFCVLQVAREWDVAIVADIGRNYALHSTTFVDIAMSATSRNLLWILSQSLNFPMFVKLAKLHGTVSGCSVLSRTTYDMTAISRYLLPVLSQRRKFPIRFKVGQFAPQNVGKIVFFSTTGSQTLSATIVLWRA